MQRMGPAQFGTGSGRVGIALAKHTPMGRGRTSGVYKDDRPVSFIFVPSTGYKWQVMKKVSTVWCKRFDGSTVDDFVKHVFRDQAKRPCVVADFSVSRAVRCSRGTRHGASRHRVGCARQLATRRLERGREMPCSGYFSHRQAGC